MMNKEEVIDKLKSAIPYPAMNDYQRVEEEALIYALELVEDIDEPEKPVIPKYVADMIVKRKEQGFNLVATLVSLGAFGDAQEWIRSGDNGDTFAKAWLYGYEIDKEKRYTAKLKLTNEYLCYESQFKDLLHYKVPDSSAKEVKAYHFTEDDLVKYSIWGNNYYEVEEVK